MIEAQCVFCHEVGAELAEEASEQDVALVCARCRRDYYWRHCPRCATGWTAGNAKVACPECAGAPGAARGAARRRGARRRRG